jgi:superfamily II DNA or RNA helicase
MSVPQPTAEQGPHILENIDQLREHGFSCNFSDTGTGKTYMAMVVAIAHGVVPLVICPKHLIATWRLAFEEFGVEVPEGMEMIHNYERFTGSKKVPFGRWDEHGRFSLPGPGDFENNPGTALVIFDEAHRMFGEYTKAAELLIGARRQRIPCLLLTATPPISPLKCRALGFAMGLHNLANYDPWARALGAVTAYNGKGLKFKAEDSEFFSALLSEQMRPYYTRLESSGFTTQVRAVPVDVPSIDALEAAFRDKLEAAGDDDHKALAAYTGMCLALEAAKIAHLCESAYSSISGGLSVVIFLNYRMTQTVTVDILSKRLGGPIDEIHGDTKQAERERVISDFQANKSRLIVCQVKCMATGVNLHDLHGRGRVFLVSPTDDAVDFVQMLGRGTRHGSVSSADYQVHFAAGSAFDMRRSEKLNTRVQAFLDAKTKRTSI